MALTFYDSWRTVSSTPSEFWKESIQALVDEQFENASNIYTIKKKNISTGLYDSIIVRLEVPYELKQQSTIADDFRKVIFRDNSVINLVGDIFDFNDSYWICTDGGRIETPTDSCIIQRCNNTLKYYNKSGISWVLNEIPCIVTTPFKTNMGEDESRYMTTSVVDYQIIIPDNTDTEVIDVGIRFILNGRAFECKGFDDISCVGLRTIKVSLVETTNDDLLASNIANYYSHQNVYSIQLVSKSIVDLYYANQTSIIEAKFYLNGVEDTIPTFTITSSVPTVCTIVQSTMTITCLSTGQSTITITYGNVTQTITVNGVLTDNNHNYALDITGVDIISIGQSKPYSALVTDNGIDYMVRPIVWALVAEDGVSNTTLASIISTSGTYNENIIIKATSTVSGSNTYGNVKLKSQTDVNSCSEVKTIEIKGLI